MRKRLLPVLIIALGFAAAGLLVVTGPEVTPRPPDSAAPLVRVVEVRPQTIQLRARTHGTVVPRTESELVPEVDGRVVFVSPTFVSGGFFSQGEELLRIDPLDYEVALEQARAGLARARSELAIAEKNHERQRDLLTRGAISDAQRDESLNRLRVAQASLREAVARLSRAERDLERTRLLAPYDGRVRTERVDVGQFVKRGTAIGSLYAVDKVEVRLPIQDEELEFLDLPLAGGRAADAAPAPVVLRARFAGSIHEWQGEVVRTEGELDPGTRMVNVVAEVADPYAPRDGQPPLAVGLFVEAEILGRIVPNLAVLPRAALRGEGRVLVVDEGNRLRFRAVDVLRRANEQVFIRAGLAAGERVCVSPLPSTADGMRVRIIDQQPDVLAATPQGGEAS